VVVAACRQGVMFMLLFYKVPFYQAEAQGEKGIEEERTPWMMGDTNSVKEEPRYSMIALYLSLG
jgi:hypothetical protein